MQTSVYIRPSLHININHLWLLSHSLRISSLIPSIRMQTSACDSYTMSCDIPHSIIIWLYHGQLYVQYICSSCITLCKQHQMTYDYFPDVCGIHSAVPTIHRHTSACATSFCVISSARHPQKFICRASDERVELDILPVYFTKIYS